MSAIFELEAESRELLGTSHNRRLRRTERVPAVIYGAGKDPLSISLPGNVVRKALESEAFYSKILTLTVGKTKEKAVLKSLQRHPAKQHVLHMDFLRIDTKAKLTMNVPIHFLNEETAPGIKIGGGILSRIATEVEISCLPADLPEYLDIDLAELELDQSLHMSDIKLPKGVEIPALAHGTDHDLPIVSIHKPKAVAVEEEAPAAAEGENGEAAEGAAENNKKDES